MSTDTNSSKPTGAPFDRPSCCGPMWRVPEDARDILDRRYASGEISKEQYEEMRRTLETP